METLTFKSRIQCVFNKYKYVALVVIIGIALMLLPTDKKDADPPNTIKESTETDVPLDSKIANLLRTMHGVGEVNVLLSVVTGEERIYQIDEDISDDERDVQRSTVIVSDASRNQQGLIKQIIPPTYNGAVVVCDGGDDPTVKFAVVDAVSKLTGLSTDRISVIKMK